MGNHTSLPLEEAFEPLPASSSVIEEQDCSQLDACDSDVSLVFSSTMSTHCSESEHDATTTPVAANVDHLEPDINCPNTCGDNPGADCSCVLCDVSEQIRPNVLESSFDSNSSINIISEQSSGSISKGSEPFTKSSETLLLEYIDQMQVLLNGISFESKNTHTVSDKTLESLNELHHAIEEFARNWYAFQLKNDNEDITLNQMKSWSYGTELSTNSTFTPKSLVEVERNDSTNEHQAIEVHGESILTKGIDDSSIYCKSFQEKQNLKILDTAFYICKSPTVATCMESTADKVTHLSSAIQADGKTSVDNLSTFIQDQSQLACQHKDELNIKDRENDSMSVAEKLSVEPFLLKSLSALQTTSRVDSLLTDAENCAGTFCPLYTDTQQQILDNKQPKFDLKEKIPSVRLNPNVSQLQEETALEHPCVRWPMDLNDIMNHESSAATLGKAVIKNALAFEKYAVLFRQAINDDVVTASIGRALCKNALLFESVTSAVNIDEQFQSQQQHRVSNPTIDVSKENEQDYTFDSIQLCSDRNKENENPTVEHLFKQSASNRKLGTLEEETRRTKCLVLSQKSTEEMRSSCNTNNWNGVHTAKPVRKAKRHNPNNDNTLNASTIKPTTAMKMKTLREIIRNGPSKEAEQERLFQDENKILNGKTLKHNETKEERWTVIKKNEDMLELEDAEDENAISLFERPLNLRSKLNELQSRVPITDDSKSAQTTKADFILTENTIKCRSKQLDSLTGIYYFANHYIFCSICNINIFNHLRVLDHMHGSIHETNRMNCTKTAPSIVTVSATLQSIWDRIDVSLGRKLFSKLVKFENDMLMCILCDTEVSGHLNVIAHVSGIEHQGNVLDKIYSTSTVQQMSKVDNSVSVHRNISWPDGLSYSSSDISLTESEGSIAEWLPACLPTRCVTSESDLDGIYYFAKNYVFCSICNINIFNSSIVLGHKNAKSHLANMLLQKQIESNQAFGTEIKLNRIWNQIERTLGGTLFHTVLCVDKNANFFCDLCNVHITIPGHLNILNHVCGKKHNSEFYKHVLLPKQL